MTEAKRGERWHSRQFLCFLYFLYLLYFLYF